MLKRIYILGAAGAGVSTLGHELAHLLDAPWFDVDDYYWAPTDPPFQIKRDINDRLDLLSAHLAVPNWVLSGSLDGWGDAVADQATHILYLDTDTDTRIARIREREFSRFGSRIRAGGDMEVQHEAFLAWAAAYDSGKLPGRSRPRHDNWLANRSVPVVRLDGSQPFDTLLANAVSATSK